VATNGGTFRSALGQEPWAFTNPALGSLLNVALTTIGGVYFAAFDLVTGAVISHSDDDGATWQQLDALSGVFVYRMASSRGVLFAGRADGLWRRSNEGLGAPPAVPPAGLGFALAGAQPVRDQARLRFTLARAGRATIDLFDVAGRHAWGRIDATWPAGTQEVTWDTHALEPGVYLALLSADGQRAAVRIVRM
jgi:hypothetical protein